MGKKNYAYVNHELLAWARSNTPFDTTLAVQDRVRISAEKIEAWEKGESLPSINEAKKLAKVYKVPFATFFLSQPPEVAPKPYTDRRTEVDAIYREPSYELWSEIERIVGNREKILECMDKEESFESLPIFDKNDSIKTIAAYMRSFLGIKTPFKYIKDYENAFIYFRRILEAKGIIVAQISDTSLKEMKGISLFYDTFPIIAVNNKDYERAKAFSLFHELAHLLRRSSSICMIDFNDRNDDEEKICDKIAAEIMMPELEFVNTVDVIKRKYNEWSIECIKKIADRYAVSYTAVALRLKETGKISLREYHSIYKMLLDEFALKQATIEAAKKNSQLRIPYHLRYLNKEGYLFTRVVISSYSRGDISYGEMCRTLNVRSAHIAKLERAVML